MIDFYQVWHNEDFRNKISPSAKYLKLEEFNAPRPANGMEIQEYRIYQIEDSFYESSNNFIGFASARWADKFPNAPSIEYILSAFKAQPPKDRMLHAFITAQPHWIEHMNYYHRGMMGYLLEGFHEIGLNISGLNLNALPMCNSYICRKDVFYEIKYKFNYLYNFYENKYGHNFNMNDNGYGNRVLGCFYERVIMGCAASCANVNYQQPLIYWQWP
jgi:hypothetical protein